MHSSLAITDIVYVICAWIILLMTANFDSSTVVGPEAPLGSTELDSLCEIVSVPKEFENFLVN